MFSDLAAPKILSCVALAFFLSQSYKSAYCNFPLACGQVQASSPAAAAAVEILQTRHYADHRAILTVRSITTDY